jgi:UDPglucose 6-dehydrogenase
VIEESQGVALARALAEGGSCVAIYDPLAMDNARAVLGDKVQYMNSARECARSADFVIITIPCDEFRLLGPGDFPRRKQRVLVLDCWRILGDRLADCAWVEYLALGVGRSEAEMQRALAESGR